MSDPYPAPAKPKVIDDAGPAKPKVIDDAGPVTAKHIAAVLKPGNRARTVVHAYTPQELERLEDNTSRQAVQLAVGYLSMRLLHNPACAHCTLSIRSSDTEMVAVYRPAEGEPQTYVIGAVWQDGRFGFHS
jgi:hypothetical protein